MTHAPLPGTPYVMTVSTPSNFHGRHGKSRLHLIFAHGKPGAWIFELRKATKIDDVVVTRIEAFARSADEPLDVERASNVVVCRADEPGGKKGEWFIGALVPDVEREGPVPFWPPWGRTAA